MDNTILKEKAWGCEEWISNNQTYGYCCKLLHVLPMFVCSLHKHLKKNEDFYVLAGEGVIEVSGERQKVTVGDIVRVPVGAYHCFATATGLTMIEASSFHREDDVVRANASAELDRRRHRDIWKALGLPEHD